MVLAPFHHPARCMNCTVVLQDEILVAINSLHRRQLDVFENPNVNIASQPLVHMDHYLRTSSGNPYPHVDGKTTATLDSLNLGFFNPTVPGSINLSARLKDLFVRKNNLSPKFFLLGNMLKGKPYPHFSMQWGEPWLSWCNAAT
jgi:hypothetical protein